MSDLIEQAGGLERARTLAAELVALLKPLKYSVPYPAKTYVIDAAYYGYMAKEAIDDAIRCIVEDAALQERIEAAIERHQPPD